MYDKSKDSNHKIIKGHIIPSSVLEAKKQRKITSKLCCLKKCFDKKIKHMSPRSCFPPAFFPKLNKNKNLGYDINGGNASGEIYENEFDTIELKKFKAIDQEPKSFKLEVEMRSIDSAIGLDVNNEVKSRRSPYYPSSTLPTISHIEDDKKNLTFALLFGDEKYFECPTSTTSATNSILALNPTLYLDEDELSVSVEFSIDTNYSSANNSVYQSTNGRPYQTIYTNLKPKASSIMKSKNISRFIVENVKELEESNDNETTPAHSFPSFSETDEISVEFSDSLCESEWSDKILSLIREETEEWISTSF